MMRTTHSEQFESGFALVATMIMLSVLLALIGAYATLTRIEGSATASSVQSTKGFYAAEAGLNIRAEEIRQVFVGYNVPTGTSPTSTSPCTGSNNGSGDFACDSHDIGMGGATSYVEADPSNPVNTTIPVGERYQNLSAQEYRFTATSIGEGADGKTRADLQLRFKSRLVPLFQFAAFYNKDLEILPGPAMTLSGPVHTNGDLYLNAETSLAITGQVTTAGDLYRGRKNTTVCNSKPVSVKDPVTARNLMLTCPSRTLINPTTLTPWNNMIQVDVPEVEVPEPEAFDPWSGNLYWDRADLRLSLHLSNTETVVTTYASTGVEVIKLDGTVDATRTTALASCAGSIGESPVNSNNGKAVNSSSTFRNKREAKNIWMLEVDLAALLNCIHTQNLLEYGRSLADSSEGGLVFFFTVNGPNSNASANRYGFRLRKGSEFRATASGAPAIKGITLVSDQAAYIAGHYNSVNKKPAAVMADSLNLLSTAWNSTWTDAASSGAKSGRLAANTTYNAAFLSGTDTTGNIDGAGGQGGAYNGGLENYPRFHEDWSNRTMTYRGSFVSLNKPRHVTGGWGSQDYTPPARDWNYDVSFNNAANLPPITPRFVYLRQQLFLRDYELDS